MRVPEAASSAFRSAPEASAVRLVHPKPRSADSAISAINAIERILNLVYSRLMNAKRHYGFSLTGQGASPVAAAFALLLSPLLP